MGRGWKRVTSVAVVFFSCSGPLAVAVAEEVDASIRLRAAVSAGDLGGLSVRPEHLPSLKVRLSAAPRWQTGRWRLRLPVSLRHRQTFTGNLSELRVRGGLDFRVRQSKALRLGGLARLEGMLRPGWPDLYQPLPGGGFEPTGRFSYLSPQVRLRAGGNPFRRNAWSAALSWRRYDYRDDPAYDPDVPTHLVPGDRTRLSAEVGWHYLRRRHRAGGGFELRSTRFDFAYARDAGTGKTHAAPGGPPANPLQRFVELRPSLDYRWKRKKGILRRVALRYLHRIQIDTYEGYYSFSAPSPSLEVKLKMLPWLRATLDAGAELRRYGPGSYDEGGSHPPLESGDRRVSRMVWVDLGLDARVRRGVYLTLDLSYRGRRTNFPDYEPGVFPATRAYDVRWDYDNVWVFGGVRWGHRYPLPSLASSPR